MKKDQTCEAKEKLGPGDRFLLGAGGALLATPPDVEPFLFRLLLAGLCDSKQTKECNFITYTNKSKLSKKIKIIIIFF